MEIKQKDKVCLMSINITRVGSSCGCTGGNLSYPSFDCPHRKSTRLPKPVGSTTEFVLQGALHIPSRAKEIPYAICNCFDHQDLPLSNTSEDSTIPFLPQPIHSCCQCAIENGTAETITLGIGVKPIKHFPQSNRDPCTLVAKQEKKRINNKKKDDGVIHLQRHGDNKLHPPAYPNSGIWISTHSDKSSQP